MALQKSSPPPLIQQQPLGMTYDQMDRFIHRVILPEVMKTRDEGQKEYARDTEDVFHNFKRVASFTGDSEEKAILTYLIKHIDGIAAYVDGHKSQREPIDGRVIDAIVYLFLLYGLITEPKNMCIETPYPDETEKSATPIPEFE